MRTVLLAATCLALASPAAAQVSDSSFAHLSALDAAVFRKANDFSTPVAAPLPETMHFVYGTNFKFHSESFTTLRSLYEIQRTGGSVSMPAGKIPLISSVPFVGTFLRHNFDVVEAEGARDVYPGMKSMKLGRIQLSKRIDRWNATTGIEFGLYRGSPPDLHGLPSADQELVIGGHFTKQFGSVR